MKITRKIAFLLVISALVLAAFCSCNGDGTESEPVSTVSETDNDKSGDDISLPDMSNEDESGTSLPEQSSGEESEDESSSEDISEPDESMPDESGEIGPLFESYAKILAGNEKTVTTVESKTVGGVATPYTTTASYRGDLIYVEIEEAYGNISCMLMDGDAVYLIDNDGKSAVIVNASDAGVKPVSLYTGAITLKESGKEELFDREYDFESYTDETGKSFDLFFSGGSLERYRSYDESVGDTIVISLGISADTSGAMFEIPSDYTVVDAR